MPQTETPPVVPATEEEGADEARDDEASREASDNASEGSGPPPPTFAERLCARLHGTAEVFQEAGVDVCVLGATREQEQDFEEKGLQSSLGLKDPEMLQDALAKLGLGIVCKKGKQAGQPNQDNVFFCKSEKFVFCGIADGHGRHGHWASHWVVRYTVSLVLTEILSKRSFPVEQDFVRLFNNVHEALEARANQGLAPLGTEESATVAAGEQLASPRGADEAGKFDVSTSGSTLALFLMDTTSRKAVMAWVGDARCVMLNMSETCSTETVANTGSEIKRYHSITASHNPLEMEERRRIAQHGGVTTHCGRVGPAGTDHRQPLDGGLSRHTRSIGDVTLHEYGVIHKPSVKFLDLGEESSDNVLCLLCTSEGVKDYLNNHEACLLIRKNGRQGVARAAQELVDVVCEKWMMYEDEEEMADLTALCMWV